MCTWICALGHCRGSTNWKFTGSLKKLCFHWYSLKVHHPQNIQKQQKSDFSFVAKQLKWDQQEIHTHTHTQPAESSSPTCPTLVSHSSVPRLSPVYSAALVVVCLLCHHDNQLSHVWDWEGRSAGPPAGYSAPTAVQRSSSTANCMLWVSTKQIHT